MAWVSSHKLIPGVHIVWIDQVKEGLEVIASTNHLEILCFVTEPPLACLPKKLFWFPSWGRTLNVYPQGPDGAEQGQFLATRRGGSTESAMTWAFYNMIWHSNKALQVYLKWTSTHDICIYLPLHSWTNTFSVVETAVRTTLFILQRRVRRFDYQNSGIKLFWFMTNILNNG